MMKFEEALMSINRLDTASRQTRLKGGVYVTFLAKHLENEAALDETRR